MDFEEILEANFIRKEKPKVRETNDSDKTKQSSLYCIPLLLRDIQLLDSEALANNTCIITLNNERVGFRYCLLYARIRLKNTCSEKFTKFVLDDGSDIIELIAYKNDMSTINKLEEEVLAIEQSTMDHKKQGTVQCLKNILSRVHEQLDYTSIPENSRILVCGLPSKYRDKISIKAKCITQDSIYSRDLELAFKDYLLGWYQEKSLV